MFKIVLLIVVALVACRPKYVFELDHDEFVHDRSSCSNSRYWVIKYSDLEKKCIKMNQKYKDIIAESDKDANYWYEKYQRLKEAKSVDIKPSITVKNQIITTTSKAIHPIFHPNRQDMIKEEARKRNEEKGKKFEKEVEKIGDVMVAFQKDMEKVNPEITAKMEDLADQIQELSTKFTSYTENERNIKENLKYVVGKLRWMAKNPDTGMLNQTLRAAITKNIKDQKGDEAEVNWLPLLIKGASTIMNVMEGIGGYSQKLRDVGNFVSNTIGGAARSIGLDGVANVCNKIGEGANKVAAFTEPYEKKLQQAIAPVVNSKAFKVVKMGVDMADALIGGYGAIKNLPGMIKNGADLVKNVGNIKNIVENVKKGKELYDQGRDLYDRGRDIYERGREIYDTLRGNDRERGSERRGNERGGDRRGERGRGRERR